jgi:hypothetical protein
MIGQRPSLFPLAPPECRGSGEAFLVSLFRNCRSLREPLCRYSETRVAVSRRRVPKVAFSSRKSHLHDSSGGHVDSGFALSDSFQVTF